MSYFIYNGRNSNDFDIRIQTKNIYSAPKFDASTISIPGRDGDMLNPSGRFGNVNVSYTCYVPAKTIQELSDKITRIKNWLYEGVNAYHDLRDSYDSDFRRKAVFNNKFDISDQVRKIGVFTVNFSCYPFRYSLEGLETISIRTVKKTWCFSDPAFSGISSIKTEITVDGLTLIGTDSKSLNIKSNTVTVDGVQYTVCLATNGSGNVSQRAIKVFVNGDAILKVIAGAAASRSLVISDSSGNEISTITIPTEAAEVTFHYTGNEEYLYLYSKKDNINFYKISVDSQDGAIVTRTITNPFSFASKPYLKIYGNGMGTLMIQSGTSNKIWQLEIDDYIEIDSEKMNCYKGTLLRNDKVSGDGFQTFEKGENNIIFSGEITAIDIVPRWVSL